jgi:hypothetical protein
VKYSWLRHLGQALVNCTCALRNAAFWHKCCNDSGLMLVNITLLRRYSAAFSC